MGLGTDPFGAEPLGFDAIQSTDQRVASVPAALAFDGLTLDFSLDSAGRFVGAHPIDTKVFHRLRIRGGTLRSAPATGNGVASQSHIDPLTIESQVRDEVRLATEDMIAAGEIQDRGVVLDLSVRGRVSYVYSYVNLRTGKPGSFRSQ